MHDSLLTHGPARDAFSPARWLADMVRFEVALAEAQAEVGLIPEAAARAIAAAAADLRLDAEGIVAAARADGNPAIPFVRDMTAALPEGDARAYLHWGATSQDVLDTALMLRLREALGLVLTAVGRLGDALAGLADGHRDTVMIGRTLLRHASPITLGFKAAVWLDPLVRHRRRVVAVLDHGLALQLGGAVGTLSAMGADGAAVVAAVARRLDLPAPPIAWHTSRDRLAEVACVLGGLIGSCAKIGRDMTLMMQDEVGEAIEAHATGGGSSTLPHKRNPTRALIAPAAHRVAAPLVASAILALEQEHERAAGAWHGEWPVLPRLVELAMVAVDGTREALEALEIDTERLCANIEHTGGLAFSEALSFALARALGRPTAKSLVTGLAREAVATGRSLKAMALDSPQVTRVLSGADIDMVFDPAGQAGGAAESIARVLQAWRQ